MVAENQLQFHAALFIFTNHKILTGALQSMHHNVSVILVTCLQQTVNFRLLLDRRGRVNFLLDFGSQFGGIGVSFLVRHAGNLNGLFAISFFPEQNGVQVEGFADAIAGFIARRTSLDRVWNVCERHFVLLLGFLVVAIAQGFAPGTKTGKAMLAQRIATKFFQGNQFRDQTFASSIWRGKGRRRCRG